MRANDIGTNIKFTIYTDANQTVPLDLTNASAVKVNLKLNEHTKISRTASVVSATRGVIVYKTVEGDISEGGLLQMEIDITFSDGSHFTSNAVTETVYSIL